MGMRQKRPCTPDIPHEFTLARKRRLTDIFNDLHLHNTDQTLLNRSTNPIPEAHINSGVNKEILLDYSGLSAANTNKDAGAINKDESHNHEVIDSIDDYLKDYNSDSEIPLMSLSGGTAGEVSARNGVADSDKEPRRYYISKKFIDPFIVLKNQSDTKTLQEKKKLYYDKIISSRNLAQKRGTRRGLAGPLAAEKSEDQEDYGAGPQLESEEDGDLMDIDEGAGFKRQKIRQDREQNNKLERKDTEVSNEEIYYQMYLAENYSLVKYRNPQRLVWERWWVWRQRQKAAINDCYYLGTNEDKTDDVMMEE